MRSYVPMLISSLAPTTISGYDTLARSSSEGALRSAILKLKPSGESLAPSTTEIQAALPFDLPFLIWANFRRRLGMDCYEQVSDVFGATCFSRDQFELWYRSMEQRKLEVCAPPIRTSVTVQPNKRRKTATSRNNRESFPAGHSTRERKRRQTRAQSTPIPEQEAASLPLEDRFATSRSSVGTGEEVAAKQAGTGGPDDGTEENPSSATSCSDAASDAQTKSTEIGHPPASSAGERAILGLNDGVPLQTEPSALQPHAAERSSQASTAEGYSSGLSDGVSPQALESRPLTMPQNYVNAFLASEHRSTRLDLLLQAAAQQADPVFAGMDCHMGVQELSRVGEAFMRTGNPDAMLGVPERSIEPDSREEEGQSCCNTDPGWGKGESHMDMVIGVEELYDY